MNRKCFRVIFSKALRHLTVVTSELAKTADKAALRETESAVGFVRIFTPLKPLTFRLFCAWGFVAFALPAEAETLTIKADANAPKNQQAIILQTANGLPQVNIQTPNEKGLSHNKYQNFDVDSKGAILNNSRRATETQQAGMIQGNPYLARGEAKVILNEVTSNNPSVLKGYVEVAGKKAEVIIANPNGLQCEGCGVINASRATLTTGKPQLKDGKVDGYRVTKGKVTVGGKGMDNSRVDYTDIIAREAEINAGVWANKKLNVVTGENTVKPADNPDDDIQITRLDEHSTENAPHFAVDVSELGGMYAGKIHLVGTEQGVGVRNAGHIGAGSESLTVDSKGKIVNRGNLSSQQQILVKSEEGIENTGRIEAETQQISLRSDGDIRQDGSVIARRGTVSVQAKNAITQRGETSAKGNVTYRADNIRTDKSALIAAGISTAASASDTRQGDNRSAQGAAVDIRARNQVQLSGRHRAAGKLSVSAQNVDMDNSRNDAYDIAIEAESGDVRANNAAISAVRNLTISTPQTLSVQGSDLSARSIKTNQWELDTRYARWRQTGTEDLNLNAHRIQNQNGTLYTAGRLNLNAHEVDNRDGTLIAGRRLNMNISGSLDSTRGVIEAGSGANINSGALINRQGSIQSRDNIMLNSRYMDNTHGIITANQNVSINVRDWFGDQNSTVTSRFGNVSINAPQYRLHNEPATEKRNITIRPAAPAGDGLINATGGLVLDAGKMLQRRDAAAAQKARYAAGQNTISAKQAFINANPINTYTEEADTQSLSQRLGGFLDRYSTQLQVVANTLEVPLPNRTAVSNSRINDIGLALESGATVISAPVRQGENNAFQVNISPSLETALVNGSIRFTQSNDDIQLNFPDMGDRGAIILLGINPNQVTVETDSQFTDFKHWLNSKYMFNMLRHEHETVQKRFGGNFSQENVPNERINPPAENNAGSSGILIK